VPYQGFATRGGDIVVAAGNDGQFGRLLAVLGLRDDGRRYATNASRVAHRADPWLAEAIARRERDELLAALARSDVPARPVNSVGQALAAIEATHPGGWLQEREGIRVPPDPAVIDGDRLPLRAAPPRLGEDTDAVLQEAGYEQLAIDALRRDGVVG
jgi:crotonobetainyl-CoA:carnitine CoA-transferase CaiB-like acyl-CoA transferase